MYPFTYHRPTTLAEAVRLLESLPDGKVLAGGQTLVPVMKQRLTAISDLIDLQVIPDLRGIREEPGRLVMGALTRHNEAAGSEPVQRLIPALARLAGGIGDPHLRNLGSLGGSIANADPAADYPAAVLALGGEICTNRRIHGADDFFTGLFETALAPEELVISVSFPCPERAAYLKMPNPASRYAMVGVFVARFPTGQVRLAVTGAGAHVFRVAAMEEALTRHFDPGALDGLTVPADDLNADIHASAEYRAHLIPVLARRAVVTAMAT